MSNNAMGMFCLHTIRTRLPLYFLLLTTLIVYGRILGHDFIFNWDDSFYVIDNEAVHGFSLEHIRIVFSSYYVGNYSPVQMLSYMLDYSIWGLKPGGYLLTNLLIHLLNGFLVSRLLVKLYGDRYIALAGAAFFLLHPVQVESVAWVSQRKTLLAMFFFLLAWKGYIRFRDSASAQGRYGYYFTSVAALVLAILSKSVVVVFPLVIIAYDYCFPVLNQKARLLDKVPFIIVSGIAVLLSLVSQMPDESVWGGGGGRVTSYHGGSLTATFFTMLPVFCRYLGLVLFPTGLRAEYAVTIHRTINSEVLSAVCTLVVISLLTFRLFRADRRIAFGALIFWIGFLPVSQIVPLVTLMNDRYLYFPMLGAAALFANGTAYICRLVGGRYLVLSRSVVVILIILLSAVTLQRVSVWQNAVTFWQDAARKNPNLSSSWEKLGEAYHAFTPPKREDALRAYHYALQRNPASEITLYNLGILYTELGDYNEAQSVLSRLLEITPEHVMGLTALGNVFLQEGRYAEAEMVFKQAQSLQPDAVQISRSLGLLEFVRGRLDQARSYYGEIEGKGWGDASDAYQMARIEAMTGRRSEALSWLKKALDRGYTDYKTIADSTEFIELHNDPRFLRMMKPNPIAKPSGSLP